MKMSGKIPHTFSTGKELLLRLIRLYLDNVRLTVAEKLTVVFSAAVVLISLLVLGIFALAFFSGAMVQLLALVLPQWACYAICFGFFVLLMILVLTLRKWVIINPIARFVSRLIFEEKENEKSHEEHVTDK